MSLRQQMKDLSKDKNPPFYLVYFMIDKTVSVISGNAISEESTEREVGKLCHVKEKSKLYEGMIVTYGSKDDCVNVEDQFLAGVYTPDFLEGICDDDDSRDSKENEEPVVSQPPPKKRKKKADHFKKQEKKKTEPLKQKKNKKETFKIDAVSSLVLSTTQSTETSVVFSSANSSLPSNNVCTPTVTPVASTATDYVSPCSTGFNTDGILDAPSSSSSFDQEAFNSLAFRVEKLENQNSFLMSQYCNIATHLFGKISHDETQSQLMPVTGQSVQHYINSPPLDILTISSPVLSACPSQSVTPPLSSFQGPVLPACDQPIISPFQQPHNPLKQQIIQKPFLPAQQPIIQPPITTVHQPISSVHQQTTPVHQPITPVHQPITPVHQPFSPVNQQTTPVQQLLNSVQQLTAQSHFIHQPVIAPSGTPPSSDSPPPLPPPICNLSSTQSQSPVFQEPLLLDPDVVVRKYPKYRNVSQAGRLAVRLAVESYFGTEMLRQCTVYGLKGNKRLPVEKVEALKQKMLTLYSDTAVEFEALWTKCINAINHHASGLRKKSLMLHT